MSISKWAARAVDAAGSHPKKSHSRDRTGSDTGISAPMGRPVLGAEIRIRVQTSVARSTRDVLAEQGVTLAQIFDECALQLRRHE
jgi:hypothetical protein